MRRGTRIGLIVGTIIMVVAMFFLCAAVLDRGNGAPAPAVTSTPVVQETEDCDDEDRAKKQVDECGFGVLLEPGKKSTAPVVKPPVTRCTKIPARKC